MPVWIPIALAVTALAAVGASRSTRVADLAPGGPAPRAGAARTSVPSAIETLCAFLRTGQAPPREIAQLAYEEATAAGILDLARDIQREFLSSPARANAPDPVPVPGSIRVGRAQPSDAALLGMPGAPAQEAPIDRDAALLGVPGVQAAPSAIDAESPIRDVPAEAWHALCAKLERERPEYDSQRHVGRYRQSKDRLRELGIDPASIACHPAAQDRALGIDLGDAYAHLSRAGVIDRVVGRNIVLPDMQDAPVVTLSGLLAVCSASGLEGCASWLRSKTDRARFRHTTNLFLRCNGIF